jgi:hypothetical protein
MGAKADGVHDDTAAIEAAFELLVNKTEKHPACVVYFPAGTYKITKTVEFGPRQGGTILGHGGATTLVWGGVKSNESVMLLYVICPPWTPLRHFESGGEADTGEGP